MFSISSLLRDAVLVGRWQRRHHTTPLSSEIQVALVVSGCAEGDADMTAGQWGLWRVRKRQEEADAQDDQEDQDGADTDAAQ
jgi:hypothetical protein